jgi:hypothetical protein
MGRAVNYLQHRNDVGRMTPDYRGGVSFAKGFGHMIGAEEPGLFLETNSDAVFLSRFDKDLLLYAQNRAGYTVSIGGVQTQLFWNFNATMDGKRQAWANFAETGPGVRVRFPGLPNAMMFSVSMLRGAYTVPQDGQRRSNFYDLRAGFWYAITH